MSNKQTVTSTPKGNGNKGAAVTTTTGPSKRQIAARIFRENAKLKEPKARKDVIERMISEANLTKAGAATYYQNFKSGAWSTEPVAKKS